MTLVRQFTIAHTPATKSSEGFVWAMMTRLAVTQVVGVHSAISPVPTIQVVPHLWNNILLERKKLRDATQHNRSAHPEVRVFTQVPLDPFVPGHHRRVVSPAERSPYFRPAQRGQVTHEEAREMSRKRLRLIPTVPR